MPIDENSPTMKTVRACIYTGLFTALATAVAAEMNHRAEEEPCEPAGNEATIGDTAAGPVQPPPGLTIRPSQT